MLLAQHLCILNQTLLPASWQRFCFKILKPPSRMAFFVFTAVRTGLEPATHGVTGRYSNQLNYRTSCKTSCKIKLIFNSTKYFLKILSV
jgi:hypothetical protein